ncbi:MAG: hypothetical protein KC931_15480 [Candidatus Omnitrophica bacterium]|nr:hypothetical protein [Candidatus Omnitrophota bacterium]
MNRISTSTLRAIAMAALFLTPVVFSTLAPKIASSRAEEKTLVPSGEAEVLYQFAIEWYSQGIDAADLIEFLTNGLSPFPTPTPTSTLGVPTPTMTMGGPTPTPTEPAGNTFDFKDFFILAQNSNWHYTGIRGTGTDDDFSWTVESQMQDVGDGKMATRILTQTDDSSDEFNNHVDFWYADPSGQIFYHGFFLPQEEDFGFASIPSQNIVFADPVLLGGDGMMVGDEVTDSGTGEVLVDSFLGSTVVTGLVTSTVQYTDFIPTFETPLGTFTNVLRVRVDISAEVSGEFFEITNSTFFLKEGVGMIAQDQDPDPNDAQVQAIDMGQVGGVGIAAN